MITILSVLIFNFYKMSKQIDKFKQSVIQNANDPYTESVDLLYEKFLSNTKAIRVDNDVFQTLLEVDFYPHRHIFYLLSLKLKTDGVLITDYKLISKHMFKIQFKFI